MDFFAAAAMKSMTTFQLFTMHMTDDTVNKSFFGMLLSVVSRDLHAHICISYLFNLLINSCAIFS